MISTEFATVQLNRMSGLNFFPIPKKGDDLAISAFRELRLALECAATDSIGKVVVDDWIRNNADAPKPADLRTAAYVENERHERQKSASYAPPMPPKAHCPACQDSGVVESTGSDDLNSVASWCDCAAGQERKRTAHGPSRRCNPRYSVCPQCVNESRKRLAANQNRNRIWPTQTKEREMKPLSEIYHGEF